MMSKCFNSDFLRVEWLIIFMAIVDNRNDMHYVFMWRQIGYRSIYKSLAGTYIRKLNGTKPGPGFNNNDNSYSLKSKT